MVYVLQGEGRAVQVLGWRGCGVLNCGGGKCIHKLLEDRCPHCGSPMVEVTVTGFRFCSSRAECDYEVECGDTKKKTEAVVRRC